jgi:hypothetical protein
MMTTYETYENSFGETMVKRIEADGSATYIPSDPANSDYQRYLRWLENPDAEENGTIS